MKAMLNGKIIAESNDTIVIESNHYFPIESLNHDFLARSERTTVCSWKGKANYYNVVVDGHEIPEAAFYYPNPKRAASSIKNRVAFWRGIEITP